MEFNVLRAYLDNDNRYVRSKWQSINLDRMASRAYDAQATVADGYVEIRVRDCINAVIIEPIVRYTNVWRVYPDGAVDFALDCARNTELFDMPRFGLRLFLPERFDAVEYLGYEPLESYEDKHHASWYGKFTSDVDELAVDYIRPQKNGSRFGCDAIHIAAPDAALAVEGEGFSFNTSHYTREELTEKKHNYELEKCGNTVLCLDYRMQGVGSNSCGPELLPQYRILEDKFTFRLGLRPTVG